VYFINYFLVNGKSINYKLGYNDTEII